MSQFAAMKSGAEMREHILGKATEDAEFRTRLASDPKAVLTDEFGVDCPTASPSRSMRIAAPTFTWSCRRTANSMRTN